ncbi:MAG TPA: helix-turn-helix domain-containing protein [Flavilitoribacter sp.]|nr:helix-turn-helix domain-containing protein [Flavilitoribacter sp.]HMQ89123.1 helix-turn-helix domain-containing protein [Flavilitoribacter sp.]
MVIKQPDNHLNVKTREELAHELGISYSTLWRRLKENNLLYPRRLLSPKDVAEIKSALGFSPPGLFNEK